MPVAWPRRVNAPRTSATAALRPAVVVARGARVDPVGDGRLARVPAQGERLAVDHARGQRVGGRGGHGCAGPRGGGEHEAGDHPEQTLLHGCARRPCRRRRMRVLNALTRLPRQTVPGATAPPPRTRGGPHPEETRDARDAAVRVGRAPPGSPLAARRHLDPGGAQPRRARPLGRARRGLPVPRRRGGPRPARGAQPRRAPRLPARRRDRHASTACARTAPGSLERGLRFNPAKLLVDPYARAIVGDVTSPERPASGDRRRPAGARHPRLGAVRAARRRRRRRVRLGRRRRPRHAVGRDGRLRDARQGLHRQRTPASPSTCAGTYAGLAHPAAIEHLVRARRHRRRAAAGAPLGRRAAARRARHAQLLGLHHARLLRARTRRTPPTAAPARRSTSSRPW